jgi:phosphoglycerate kinase
VASGIDIPFSFISSSQYSSNMALSMKMQSARVIAGRRVASCAVPRVASVAGPRLSKSFGQEVAAFQAAPVRVSHRAQRTSRVVVEAVKRSVGDLKKADLEGKRVLVRADLNVPLDKQLNISDDTRIRAAIPTLKYLMDNGAKVLLTSHLVSDAAWLDRSSSTRSLEDEELHEHRLGDRSLCLPLCSQGRPKGEDKAEDKKKFSLQPVLGRLSECLGKPVSAKQRGAFRPCHAMLLPSMHELIPCMCASTIQVKLIDDCIGPVVADAVSNMKNGELILLENVRFYKEEEKNDPEFSKKVGAASHWQPMMSV